MTKFLLALFVAAGIALIMGIIGAWRGLSKAAGGVRKAGE